MSKFSFRSPAAQCNHAGFPASRTGLSAAGASLGLAKSCFAARSKIWLMDMPSRFRFLHPDRRNSSRALRPARADCGFAASHEATSDSGVRLSFKIIPFYLRFAGNWARTP
jgi:hypothetical protein